MKKSQLRPIAMVLACVTLVLGGCQLGNNNKSTTGAAPRVGVVDMQKIVKQSPEAKSLNASIEKQFSGQHQQLLKQQADYQKKVAAFQKNQSVEKPAQLKATQQTLEKEAQKLQADQSNFQQAVMAAQNKAMTDFLAKVQKASASVASKQGLSLVLPKKMVLFIGSDADVTNAVIEQMK